MKSFEFTGKNVEKAIENGLKELGKNREDVDIKILSEGGLFSKAKIVMTIEDEDVDEEVKTIIDDNEDLKEEYPVDACTCGCDHEDVCSCADCECEECEGEESACNCDDDCDCGCKEGKPCLCEEEKVEPKKERVYLTDDEVIEKIQEIFANIFKALNIDGKVMVLTSDEAYEVKISSDDKVSSLIGYRGEGLNAYQVVINSMLELRNKSKKILIDVENYRDRREESLKALAQRIAKKVVKTKKRHKFEPMSAYERHVIHEELANFKGVTTHSEGVEPHRCLIVDIEK